MRNLTEANLTDAVLAKLEGAPIPRFRQVMSSVIKHLHACIREVELTEAEWFAAIQFLTAVGKKCDDKRQEFILLSDTLGASMLVDAIHHRGRHPYRPAHIHAIVTAPGYVPVTTHVFAAGDQYLDSGAVFGVKDSLVVKFIRHEAGTASDGTVMKQPYFTVAYDFGLQVAQS